LLLNLTSLIGFYFAKEALMNIPPVVYEIAVKIAAIWPWFGKKLNTFAINKLMGICRTRPHPWSTVHAYVSWTSLTDQRWSARHLPETELANFPDVEQLKLLFARTEQEQRYCDKSTCLFPAFAQYLTDGFIRTKMPSSEEADDPARKQNTSNHQIDLCTLYGRTPEQTAVLRLNLNLPGQKGRLKSQILNTEEYSPFLYDEQGQNEKPEFAALDKPLGLDKFPAEIKSKIFAVGGDRVNSAPQVVMMNTLFLREHNRLAGELEEGNPDWDDERVFETARNIVIVLFLKIVIEEYINHASSSPVKFKVDPSMVWHAKWNKANWITSEFSLLYRWHSLIPDKISWCGKAYAAPQTFMRNQLLLDSGLLSAFTELSQQAAGRLGAFNTNAGLLDVEKKAILQGRICKLASYASYRQYVSLPRPKSFADISSDPKVAAILAKHYNNPEEVEFYVGIFAEDKVENSPLSATILRMVAVDAFSQALTNPLLSEHVFNPKTFSQLGWDCIQNTSSLQDILARNVSESIGQRNISMTLKTWQRQ
jgi:prostaglandin-endoperoxide synthase 2